MVDLNQIGIDPLDPAILPVLEDLQGNILKSHGRDHAAHLFLRFRAGPAEARRWIRDFADQYVTSAQRQLTLCEVYRSDGTCGGLFGSLLLSAAGYRALGFSGAQIPGDRSFQAGLKTMGTRLGDPPVETWEEGFRGEIHALALLADDQAPRLAAAVGRVGQSLAGVADIVALETGAVLRNALGQAIEHFGFVDGISQPQFLHRDIQGASEEGELLHDPGAPLGLALSPDPNGRGETDFGSYMVFRKLEQDVRRFRAREKELAEALGVDPELASAYAVGRFRDGTPISLFDRPGAPRMINNFTYAAESDPRCPAHAHIRKTNPRGSSSLDYSLAETERGHRIVRRGISYGVLDLDPPPGEKVGLLFMCFQADIGNQFELMQASWANDCNFLKQSAGLDPIAGQGEPGEGQRWPRRWGEPDDTLNFDFSRFVQMRGGEYFYAPSLSFLRNLA
jgi:Dyp-type peroxidase family